jgi:predicted nucleic acid-binding protein
MAAKPVLVDSSYYIGLARQGIDPLQTLGLASMERDLAVCGVVRCEVARGLRNRNVLDKFQRFWEVMIYVPSDIQLWKDVEEAVWRLDREGITLPLTDIVIGCSARRIGAAVLTFDNHFYQIPGLTVLRNLES